MAQHPPFGVNVIDPLLAVRGGEDYDLEITRRSLEYMKSVGIPALEYSHALHWSEAELAAVREMTAEIGLYPWSLHCWVGGNVLEEEGARSTLDYLKRSVSAAQGLEVGVIVHHAQGRSLAGEGRRLLEVEARLLAEAAQPGVRFALENVAGVPQWEYVIALVDTLGPDVAGCNVDTGHANLTQDLSPGLAIRMAGPRLITTHLQDNFGQRDDHLPPFDGLIDWSEVASALRDIGYQGCLMIEQTDQPSENRRTPAFPDELRRGAVAGARLAEMVWG